MLQNGPSKPGSGSEWRNIAAAVDYFVSAGWKYLDVPWIVPRDISSITCPVERWTVTSSLGDLVGSAEQSFLSLDLAGTLNPGRYLTCTPCFRNEDQVDHLHHNTFMKVELYVKGYTDEASVFDLASMYVVSTRLSLATCRGFLPSRNRRTTAWILNLPGLKWDHMGIVRIGKFSGFMERHWLNPDSLMLVSGLKAGKNIW